MIRLTLWIKRYGFLLSFVLVFCGCRGATPPVEFYTLSPISPSNANEMVKTDLQSIAIGVGPITLPEYLDRTKIVTRSGQNRLSVSEFHRWGGSLDKEILRILAENLSILLKSSRVFVYPWVGEFRPDYSISFVINAFEGQPGSKVQLKVNWTLIDNTGSGKTVHRISRIEATAVEADFDAIAAAKSRIIADFSKEIVEEIYKTRN